MTEIGPEHPLTYRLEIAKPLFQLILARESCAIVGPSSMGKGRLLQFIVRPDVRRHYLRDQAMSILFAVADNYRLAEMSEWGFYELLLTAMVEASGQLDRSRPLRPKLDVLRKEVILNHNALLAQRLMEEAAVLLCQENNLTLCVILDEFDQAYKLLPDQALGRLRSLRDSNKYRLCYILALREFAREQQISAVREGFYELFSKSVIGLKPYSTRDARRVIRQLEVRRSHQFPAKARSQMIQLSGRHAGLLLALFDVMLKHQPPKEADLSQWALDQPSVQDECFKLWESLSESEQSALRYLSPEDKSDSVAHDNLILKGLLQIDNDKTNIFSPIFKLYIQGMPPLKGKQLQVDTKQRRVWVEGKPTRRLPPLEFKLLSFLYEHLGEVCEHERVLKHIYGNKVITEDQDPKLIKQSVENPRLAKLVDRVRQIIEPAASHPRYLLTERGVGYRLVDTPEPNS